MILKIFGSAHSPFVKTFYRTSKRSRIQSPLKMPRSEARLSELGRDGQFSEAQRRKRCADRCHKATKDEGEAHGCADINAAQDVQALIAEGQDANSNLIGYRTFFSLVFFVHAKKTNSSL